MASSERLAVDAEQTAKIRELEAKLSEVNAKLADERARARELEKAKACARYVNLFDGKAHCICSIGSARSASGIQEQMGVTDSRPQGTAEANTRAAG